jgi:hypothetical protein
MSNGVEIQYHKWNNLSFNVNNFKQNVGVNYMTEHITPTKKKNETKRSYELYIL